MSRYNLNTKKNICPKCNLQILRLKRKDSGELKLYCDLCKQYFNLHKWLVNKLGKTFFNKKSERKKMKKQKGKMYIETTSIPDEKLCKKCSCPLEIRKYKKLPVKLSRKGYYFSEWEYCSNCGSVFFEEKNKVILTEEMKEKIKRDFHGKSFANNNTPSLFDKKMKDKKLFNKMYREQMEGNANFMNRL